MALAADAIRRFHAADFNPNAAQLRCAVYVGVSWVRRINPLFRQMPTSRTSVGLWVSRTAMQCSLAPLVPRALLKAVPKKFRTPHGLSPLPHNSINLGHWSGRQTGAATPDLSMPIMLVLTTLAVKATMKGAVAADRPPWNRMQHRKKASKLTSIFQ
ncbi:hypothetical protein B0H19DRAFT_1077743 [Mycena capillaripes]|nr:hypothetical protein B0H19DRAFT_1077743 [Mycena capillaripes]